LLIFLKVKYSISEINILKKNRIFLSTPIYSIILFIMQNTEALNLYTQIWQHLYLGNIRYTVYQYITYCEIICIRYTRSVSRNINSRGKPLPFYTSVTIIIIDLREKANILVTYLKSHLYRRNLCDRLKAGEFCFPMNCIRPFAHANKKMNTDRKCRVTRNNALLSNGGNIDQLTWVIRFLRFTVVFLLSISSSNIKLHNESNINKCKIRNAVMWNTTLAAYTLKKYSLHCDNIDCRVYRVLKKI